MRKKMFWAASAVMLLVVAAGWFGRKPLLARYYTAQLVRCDDAHVDACIEAVAGLGEVAIPRIIALLNDDGNTAARAGETLGRLLDGYADNDPRAAALAKRLVASFAQFSPTGKLVCLQLMERLLAKGAARDSCRDIVRHGLTDAAPAIRELAINFAVRPELGLEPNVLPLLHDPELSVRRSAMLAIGSSRDLVADDDLLPWLHDPDVDVRGLCETALRARGLRERDLQLGRLLTDPSPLKRLQVIDFLPTDDQLDVHAWLQRLSHDPVPAVRAGAARAGVDPDLVGVHDFTTRIRQMAESDPDGTVRQIAADLLRTTHRR